MSELVMLFGVANLLVFKVVSWSTQPACTFQVLMFVVSAVHLLPI